MTCICLWFTGWINGQTGPQRGWAYRLENYFWNERGHQCQKQAKRLISNLTSSSRQLSSLDVFFCFLCFRKWKLLLFVLFLLLCFLLKPLPFLARVEIMVIVKTRVCFNLEFEWDFRQSGEKKRLRMKQIARKKKKNRKMEVCEMGIYSELLSNVCLPAFASSWTGSFWSHDSWMASSTAMKLDCEQIGLWAWNYPERQLHT